jgi:hypothetical protein
MIVGDIKVTETGQCRRLSAQAVPSAVEGVSLEPFFEFSPSLELAQNIGDPFAAGLLVPSMFIGEDLRIEAPVSRKLISGVDRIQEILTTWNPALRRIQVSGAPPVDEISTRGSSTTGCFFSGGVDAWYTVCEHQPEISHLILVRGFDIAVDSKEEIWNQALRNVREVAAAMGKKVIDVQTNIRLLGDMRRATWLGRQYNGDFWGTSLHGSSLASVALCLQAVLSRIFIGATYTYNDLAPWGSHPLLDHLWSTEALEVVHDGAEADRMRKIERIAHSNLALGSLRVCYENRDQKYNCCVCEKCCRTMMALRACGKLQQASSFDRPLDLALVRRRLHDPHVFPWYRAILPVAEKAGDRELVETLRIVIGEKFSLEQTVAKLRARVHGMTPAALRPAISYAASRRRWRARVSRIGRIGSNPETV